MTKDELIHLLTAGIILLSFVMGYVVGKVSV